MLPRSNQICRLRLRVALLCQLVEKRVADIVPSQLVLLGRRGPIEAALHQLRREVRIRRERERARADAVPDDAFECERAGIASQPELDPPGARKLCRRQALELLEG